MLLDLKSRGVVGWATRATLERALVLDALRSPAAYEVQHERQLADARRAA